MFQRASAKIRDATFKIGKTLPVGGITGLVLGSTFGLYESIKRDTNITVGGIYDSPYFFKQLGETIFESGAIGCIVGLTWPISIPSITVYSCAVKFKHYQVTKT